MAHSYENTRSPSVWYKAAHGRPGLRGISASLYKMNTRPEHLPPHKQQELRKIVCARIITADEDCKRDVSHDDALNAAQQPGERGTRVNDIVHGGDFCGHDRWSGKFGRGKRKGVNRFGGRSKEKCDVQ